AEDISLNMSPMHSGLEALGRYVIVMAAIDTDDSKGVRTTGIVARLGAGDAVAATTTTPRSELPPLPETSTYEEMTRTITVGLGSNESPAIVRIILQAN